MASDPKTAAVVPPKLLTSEYGVIDTDPHVRRVFGYARRSDYALAGGLAVGTPLAYIAMERLSPSAHPPTRLPILMPLAISIGVVGGLHVLYQRSCNRFYGFTENAREVELDMREMVDKVKKGEPLYGVSSMSAYLQGVATRNSRYTSLFSHVITFPNFANHDQHGVDTAKYYQQAERELEAERLAKGSA